MFHNQVFKKPSISVFLNFFLVFHYNKSRRTRSKELSDLSSRIVDWFKKENVVRSTSFIFQVPLISCRLPLEGISIFERLEIAANRFGVPQDREVSGSSELIFLPAFRTTSWDPQPEALSVDAFSISWRRLDDYGFSPFCLIQRVLKKTMRDVAGLTLVATLWPGQPWFSTVLNRFFQGQTSYVRTYGPSPYTQGITQPYRMEIIIKQNCTVAGILGEVVELLLGGVCKGGERSTKKKCSRPHWLFC